MPWQETRKMDQHIELAMKAMNCGNFGQLCREHGISRKTGYKWRERFVARGLEGMAEDVVCRIVRLKQAHPAWGPRKIRELYRPQHTDALPSESSFKRVLERCGLTQRRVRRAGRIGRDQAAFVVWRQEFNTERPHEALAMACPAERYEPSGRRYEGTPAELDYGDRDTRKVHARTGTIWYEGRQLLITSALGGWNVGLGASVDGLVELWFANLLLGHVDPAVVAFIKIQPPAPGSPWPLRPTPLRSIDLRVQGRRRLPQINRKHVTPNPKCVTHVLNLKCYLCIDCTLHHCTDHRLLIADC